MLRYHVDVWAHLERCCVALTSYPQPPDRGQHGCAVSIDQDPPVWAPSPRQGGGGIRAPDLACVVAGGVVVDCGERVCWSLIVVSYCLSSSILFIFFIFFICSFVHLFFIVFIFSFLLHFSFFSFFFHFFIFSIVDFFFIFISCHFNNNEQTLCAGHARRKPRGLSPKKHASADASGNCATWS